MNRGRLLEPTNSPAGHAGSAPPQAGGAAIGYLLALTAGVIWGTTGPLSTALYAEGAEVTDVGFWRILVASAGLLAYGAFRPSMFKIDVRGALLLGVLGGAFVAGFEVAFQVAIAGAGVASAVALLYTAPVIVAFLAWILLGERLTPGRLALAAAVMTGAALTVGGARGAAMEVSGAGLAGGLIAALCFAGTILLARWAVPRYGAVRMLFFSIAGGTVWLAVILPTVAAAPVAPASIAAWVYIAALGGGTVLANFAFFGSVRRIEAAPASVGVTVEPVVGALLALALFGQALTAWGWLGLLLVMTGVAGGYLREAREGSDTGRVEGAAPATSA